MRLLAIFLLLTFTLASTLKFIHLNDIHLNLISSTSSRNTEPYQFFNLIKNIKRLDNEISFILDSGDIIRHSSGKSVSFKELKSIRSMYYTYINYELKAKYLPTIGNNDILPKDDLNQNNYQYKQLITNWSKFNLNLTSKFLQGGYYNYTVRSNSIAFSIVSLNTILISVRNRFNKRNCKADGIGIRMLNWLNNHLYDAMKLNTKVILLGHIPPLQADGKLAYNKNCNNKLMRILYTHRNSIELGLFGHINKNKTIELVKISNKLNFQFNKGKSLNNSVVKFMTNLSLFPGKGSYFRVFEVEGDRVARYKQYYLNLANSGNEMIAKGNDNYEDYKVIKIVNLI